MRKNSPELWDAFWASESPQENPSAILVQESNSVRWQRIERIILREFGSFEGLRVIELGAGIGTNAALMAARGAHVTLLDYSDRALTKGKEFFQHAGLVARFVKHDALSPSEDLMCGYDVSMSFGLAEHFQGSDRARVVRSHFDLLREGGLAIISVPNAYNLPYRLFKFSASVAGVWRVGEEYPFSRRELQRLCTRLGVSECSFFGDSFLSSLRFVNPVFIATRIRKRKSNSRPRRREIGTFLDPYIGYALVLCAKKQMKLG